MLQRSTLSGALAGFTTRESGVSPFPYDSANVGYHVGDDPAHVARNRQILTDMTGELTWMDQVHGTTIAWARDGGTPQADALMVTEGTGAAVMVADCVPLLLWATDLSLGAVVHVGRAGLMAGIVPRVLDVFAEHDKTDIQGIIGPHICGSCYEVSDDLAREAERFGAASITRWGSQGIDLAAGICNQAPDIDLDQSPICTLEDDRYFSYRRNPQTGRFAGVLALGRS